MNDNDNDNMSLEDVLRAIADEMEIDNPTLEIEVEDEPPSLERIEEEEILGFVPHFNCRCVVRKAIYEPPSNDQCPNCGGGMLWEYGDDDVPNSGHWVCPYCDLGILPPDDGATS